MKDLNKKIEKINTDDNNEYLKLVFGNSREIGQATATIANIISDISYKLNEVIDFVNDLKSKSDIHCARIAAIDIDRYIGKPQFQGDVASEVEKKCEHCGK